MALHTSPQGYAVIRSFEGRSLKAYKDEVGVWTIGYGNTNYDRDVLGFEIKAGVTINEEQCERLLHATMERRYEPAVRAAMGADCPQPAFDAGGSFHYNCGAIGRASWVKSFVAKNLAAVHPQLAQWNKAGGNVLAGLTRRRNREWFMIASGDYGPEGRQTVITDEHGKATGATQAAPGAAPAAPAAGRLQPWHERMESILGLYEFAGDKNNPVILAMAEQCGGTIAKSYKNDATAWCALTVNWCLITTGNKGSGSLWALDFRTATQRLDGPTVGAIATKTRNGGGHVFLVRGRTADGKLVGTGGNQQDMVCDETFDPAVCQFGWPKGLALPATVGMGTLPIVTPRPHTHKAFTALPGELHPAVQNGNPPPAVAEGTGMLRLGDTGEEVKDAQRQLVAAGFAVGVDGDFGQETLKAVLEFQKNHPQLEQTGFIDPATRKALQRDAQARTGLDTTVKTGTGGGVTTGGADAVTGFHTIPWEVYAIGGVAIALVLGYICYTYRDELKAWIRSHLS